MNWDQIGNWFVMFLSGCGVALEIFAVTLVCAIPLGVLLSFGRRSKYKVISWPVFSLYFHYAWHAVAIAVIICLLCT